MRWVGHVECIKEGRGVYRVLGRRPESKRPLERARHRWQDNIKLDLREIRIDRANWIQLAQDRVQWRALVSGSIKKVGYFLISLVAISFTNNILHHRVK
jgi:hypothetical protein